jgi:hypothetical protein
MLFTKKRYILTKEVEYAGHSKSERDEKLYENDSL